MQNNNIRDLAQHMDRYPIKIIIKRLVTECSSIFGEYNDANYQNIVAVFARLNRVNRLTEENVEDLSEFIDGGIINIASRYDRGEEIHPGTLNILIMAIQAHNQVSEHPYRFGVEFIEGITPPTEEFMEGIVQPITRYLQLFALHHAPWVNPVHVAREAARRAGTKWIQTAPFAWKNSLNSPSREGLPFLCQLFFTKMQRENGFIPCTPCVYTT